MQSLILADVLLGMGFQTFLIAFVADLLAANRKLLGDVRYNLKIITHQNEPKKEESAHGRSRHRGFVITLPPATMVQSRKAVP